MAIEEVRSARILLAGAGHVGLRFLELILLKRDALRTARGLDLVLVGVADSSGVAMCPEGLDAGAVIALKSAGRGVAEYPAWGLPGHGVRDGGNGRCRYLPRGLAGQPPRWAAGAGVDRGCAGTRDACRPRQ